MRTLNSWTEPKEELPPVGQEVLVLDGYGDYYLAHLHGHSKEVYSSPWADLGSGKLLYGLLFWRELPPKPGAEEFDRARGEDE